MEANYEGDTHAKRVKLKNLHCAFQDARMMEDESVRSYVGRIPEIVARIRSHGGVCVVCGLRINTHIST